MLLMKWFAESIYFLEIIFITTTSVLLLANNILNVSTKTIHIIALVLLVVYVCIGLLLANRKNKFTMSVNYFKLIGALAYIVLITTLKGIVFDILTHPSSYTGDCTSLCCSYCLKKLQQRSNQ